MILDTMDRLEQIAERYNGLMSVVPGGILFVNPQGIILEANDRITELTGYEPWELLGASLDILQAPGRDDVKASLEGYLQNNVSEVSRYQDICIRKKDGTTQIVHASSHMFRDGDNYVFIDMLYPRGGRG